MCLSPTFLTPVAHRITGASDLVDVGGGVAGVRIFPEEILMRGLWRTGALEFGPQVPASPERGSDRRGRAVKAALAKSLPQGCALNTVLFPQENTS